MTDYMESIAEKKERRFKRTYQLSLFVYKSVGHELSLLIMHLLIMYQNGITKIQYIHLQL